MADSLGSELFGSFSITMEALFPETALPHGLAGRKMMLGSPGIFLAAPALAVWFLVPR